MFKSVIRSGRTIALCLVIISGCVGVGLQQRQPTLAPTIALIDAAQREVVAPRAVRTSAPAVDDALPVTGKEQQHTAAPQPSETEPEPTTTATAETYTATVQATTEEERGEVEILVRTTERPATATTEPTGTPTSSSAAGSATTGGTATAVPDDWKYEPVMPSVSEHLRAVYQRGLEMGNNPNAFSVLGDCQSQPEVFMGLFDTDPDALDALPAELQETAAHFAGSFNRYSPTVKDGTTEGALLWAEWNDNKEKKCIPGETPLECELRVHQPSIVFIHVGTHYEARNYRYLTIIVERLLEHGSVPVLVTKADNTELDERINANIVAMAKEYDLPLWNFWSSVQHLPYGGLEPGSNMYLDDEAEIIHREGALQALDIIWRAVR